MGLSLASATPPQVVSLILSDVVGDPVEVIASGPTVASIHSVQDCLHILNRYGLRAALPRSVKTVLARADSDPHGPHTCGHVLNVILGSNALALAEAQKQAEALGYRAVVLSTAIQGDVKSVAQFYGLLARVAGAHLALPVETPDSAWRRQTGNGWFTGWCDGQARQKELGWGVRVVCRLGWGFATGDLAEWGSPLITAGELTGSSTPLPRLPPRSRVLPSLVSGSMHLLARPSW